MNQNHERLQEIIDDLRKENHRDKVMQSLVLILDEIVALRQDVTVLREANKIHSGSLMMLAKAIAK